MIHAPSIIQAGGSGRLAENLGDAREKVADHVVVGSCEEGIAQRGICRFMFGNPAVVDIT